MGTFPPTDIQLEGRVAIITGGERGLGLAMALALARAGGRLVLASPDQMRLDEAVSKVEEVGGAGCAHAQVTDITDRDQCQVLVAAAVEKFGQLDVLFNNARRLHRGPGIPLNGNTLSVAETDPEIFRQTVMVNVVGTFYMTQAATRHFIAAGGGKIVNVTTSRRNFSGKNNSPYGVTKAAIESETLIWARDLADQGITVNSLLPGGASDTDPERPILPDRVLLPVDIMDPLAVWLASAQSDRVTGCRFRGDQWNPDLPLNEAAHGAREEPVFAEQPVLTPMPD
jgi:3-oxoacyl-[acyl-carrier protein] reductase